MALPFAPKMDEEGAFYKRVFENGISTQWLNHFQGNPNAINAKLKPMF